MLKAAVESMTSTNIQGYWTEVAKRMPGRSAKQCRERWTYHLSKPVTERVWTDKQDKIILMAVIKYKHRFEQIVKAKLPTLQGLTALAIKNRWKCLQSRIDLQQDHLILRERGRRGRPKANTVLPPPVHTPVNQVPDDSNTEHVNQQEMFKPFSIPK